MVEYTSLAENSTKILEEKVKETTTESIDLRRYISEVSPEELER